MIAWAPNTPTRTTLPASILSLFASLAILVLSIFEHSRSVRPSFIVNIYLFASLSFDAVQTRTLYLRHEAGTIMGLFTANIVLKAILVLLESRSKRNCLKSPYNSYPPEATSGIFSQCFFWWLNPVLATGFRKLLTLDDLFKPDIKLLSGPLQEQAQSSWDKCMYLPMTVKCVLKMPSLTSCRPHIRTSRIIIYHIPLHTLAVGIHGLPAPMPCCF